MKFIAMIIIITISLSLPISKMAENNSSSSRNNTSKRKTKLIDDLEEQLKCSICLDIFKNPRVLPCHHSYCKDCVVDLLQLTIPDNTNVLCCPKCRTQTIVPDGDARKLEVDFNLMTLLDIYHTHYTETDTNDQVVQEPGPVQERGPVQGRGRVCGVHNLAIKLYCADCCLTFCHHCVAADAHQDHMVILIDEAGPVLEDKIRNESASLQEKHSLLKKQLDDIDVAIATDNEHTSSIIDSINEYYKDHDERVEARIQKYQEILAKGRSHRQLLVDELKKSRDYYKKQKQAEREAICSSISQGSTVIAQADALLHGACPDVMVEGTELNRQLQSLNQESHSITECVPATQYSLCTHSDITHSHVINPRDIVVDLPEAKVKFNKFTVTLNSSLFACPTPVLTVVVTLPNGRTAPSDDVKVVSTGTKCWEVDYFVNQSSLGFMRQNVVLVSVSLCGVEAFGSPFKRFCEKRGMMDIFLGN